MPSPLFTHQGNVAMCRGCRRVYERTATFAITHAAECRHQRLYNALYLREILHDDEAVYSPAAVARAEVVFAILGEP